MKTTSQLCKDSGISRDTLLYYESLGLIDCQDRTEGGYRLFDDDAYKRLEFIKDAKSLGFTLKEISSLIRLSEDPESYCKDARQIAAKRLQMLEREISKLLRMKSALEKVIDKCEETESKSCPILCDADFIQC